MWRSSEILWRPPRKAEVCFFMSSRFIAREVICCKRPSYITCVAIHTVLCGVPLFCNPFRRLLRYNVSLLVSMNIKAHSPLSFRTGNFSKRLQISRLDSWQAVRRALCWILSGWMHTRCPTQSSAASATWISYWSLHTVPFSRETLHTSPYHQSKFDRQPGKASEYRIAYWHSRESGTVCTRCDRSCLHIMEGGRSAWRLIWLAQGLNWYAGEKSCL